MKRVLFAGALVAGLCSYQPAHALDLSDDDLLIEMDGAEDRHERMMQRLDDLEFNNEMRHRELMDRLDELPQE